MSHYAAGVRLERRVANHLAENGYAVVRAAGSKGSTKADLIAFKPGQLLLVQCKRDGKLPAAEWDRLVEVASWIADAVPLLAATGPLGRGLAFTRLLGRKVPRARVQPCEPFAIDLIES